MGQRYNWFLEYRIAWAVEIVKIYGFINREHIMKKFGVSKPQAALDLGVLLKRYPGLLEYNRRTKCYQLAGETSEIKQLRIDTYSNMDDKAKEG